MFGKALKSFVFLASFTLIYFLFVSTSSAQTHPDCPSGEMACVELDWRYPDGCTLPCERVVTQQGGPAGRSGAIPAKCACQEPTDPHGTVACGAPCQGDVYCVSACPYCWGEFHQAPICHDITAAEARSQRQNSNTLPIFCDSSGGSTTNPDEKGSLYTAIGCIPVKSNPDFAEFFIGWGMGIGGGIAFLLMIFAGFMVMTSAGDPKRLAAGKELLTAAISGLLLIVLSAYLLRLIGVSILEIF